MYPPVGIGQVRISTSHDITLADQLHIPAGTCIWVPHHAIQNASFNWDDPDKFLPGELPFLMLKALKIRSLGISMVLRNLAG
jgi:cytochrome P450